jgi:hypothetical protein
MAVRTPLLLTDHPALAERAVAKQFLHALIECFAKLNLAGMHRLINDDSFPVYQLNADQVAHSSTSSTRVAPSSRGRRHWRHFRSSGSGSGLPKVLEESDMRPCASTIIQALPFQANLTPQWGHFFSVGTFIKPPLPWTRQQLEPQ